MKSKKSKEERIRSIREIYDWLDEPRNMSWPDFLKEYLAATAPATMQELMDIELQKARGRTEKLRIDRGISLN